MEDFIVKKNFGIARYHRTAASAFKDSEYANPYSYFKPSPIVMAKRLTAIVVGILIFFLVAWRFYV
jgi:hypothetical protein